MRMQLAASLLAAASSVSAQSNTTPVTGKLGNATVVSNNPPGAVYTATLPATAFGSAQFASGANVIGSVAAVSSPDGTGVMFKVSFSNLPTSGGPFLYHIHDQPVPASGNCTATLAHLDPTQRGEMPMCDSANPQTCQVGDLAGKYGKITSDPFSATFTDDYASTLPGIGAFFGNRSIVVHFANTTRITCANFQAVSLGALGSCSISSTITALPTMATQTATSTAASNATATMTTSTPSSTFVTAAASTKAPAALMALGVAVMAFLL